MRADPEDILCGVCHEERSTVHVTEVVGGERRLSHYCAECYGRGMLQRSDPNRPAGIRQFQLGKSPEATGMYELTIEAVFAAAHNLREYQGECENLHGHNWRVEVVVAAAELDRLGMVMDFRELKGALGEVLQGLDHKYLNDVPPFDTLNPTTENLCRTIAGALCEKLPCNVSIRRVSCWESEKCGASYTPAAPRGAEGR